jgi:hypothetical protein
MVSANVEWCRGYCIGTVVSSGGSFSLCVRGARQRASIFMPTMTSDIPRRRKSIASTGNVSRCYPLIPLEALHNSDRPPGDITGYLAVVGQEPPVVDHGMHISDCPESFIKETFAEISVATFGRSGRLCLSSCDHSKMSASMQFE